MKEISYKTINRIKGVLLLLIPVISLEVLVALDMGFWPVMKFNLIVLSVFIGLIMVVAGIMYLSGEMD